MSELKLKRKDLMRQGFDKVRERMGKRTGPPILYLEEHEDDTKLRFPTRDYADGINTMSAATTDLTEGLAWIAGLPNAGKSTLFINMICGILKQNPTAMVLDFAFDDGKDKRYQQLMACLTGLTYQHITTKMDLTDEQIAAKLAADELLNQWIDEERLRIFEPEDEIVTANGEVKDVIMAQPKNTLAQIRIAREEYPDRKIVVILDAINDFVLTQHRDGEYSAMTNVIGELKSTCKKLNVIIWINGHLTKSAPRGSEDLSNIKGSNSGSYGASWGGIVTNDFLSNPVTSPMVYETEDGRLIPVVFISIPKNKCSQFRDPLIYAIDSFRCQLIPLTRFKYEEYLTLYQGLIREKK